MGEAVLALSATTMIGTALWYVHQALRTVIENTFLETVHPDKLDAFVFIVFMAVINAGLAVGWGALALSFARTLLNALTEVQP